MRRYSLLKDRGASPLPLRRAPVPAPVYAVSSCAGWVVLAAVATENAPADFGRSEVDVLKFFDGRWWKNCGCCGRLNGNNVEGTTTMEEKYNLYEIFPLDAMHDQKITRSELSSGTLSFYFEDLHFDEPHSLEATLYYNKHRKYRGCVLTFFELDEADLSVELRKNRTQALK